jgi:hypothetical protein
LIWTSKPIAVSSVEKVIASRGYAVVSTAEPVMKATLVCLQFVREGFPLLPWATHPHEYVVMQPLARLWVVHRRGTGRLIDDALGALAFTLSPRDPLVVSVE